jgi:hypothetical protein
MMDSWKFCTLFYFKQEKHFQSTFLGKKNAAFDSTFCRQPASFQDTDATSESVKILFGVPVDPPCCNFKKFLQNFQKFCGCLSY